MAKTTKKTNSGSDFNANEFASKVNENVIDHPLARGEKIIDDGFETIVSSASFWKFDKEPQFTGTFVRPMLREQDSPDGQQKAGDIMAYVFVDEHGEEHLIGASYAIEKGLKECSAGDILRITFMGKTQNSKKQQVNKFVVQRKKK